jgi:probable F420-dependent oxidoreductase
MELGLGLPQIGGHADLGRVAEFAREAEAMGYDSLWVGDRLIAPTDPSDPYPGEPQPYPPEFTRAADPLVLWAVAAAATSRIRLGSSTLNGPWYNPVLLARALTTIDAVSGGRLDVGLGLGWLSDEYTAADVQWRSRARRLDETLDLLQAWWTTNPVKFHGEFVELPESVVDLRPVQPGGPPIYLGGFSTAAMARVGRRAEGYLAVAGLPDAVQAQLWDAARAAADSVGRDPDRIRRVLRINAAERAVDTIAPQVEAARAAGYDGAFVDLAYATTGHDDTLGVADALMARVRA